MKLLNSSFQFDRLKLIITVTILFGLSACKNSYQVPRPDVSGIEINFDPIRCENMLFAEDSANQVLLVDQFQAKYPQLSDLYFSKMMGMGPQTGPQWRQNATLFLQNEAVQSLKDSVDLEMNQLNTALGELSEGFKHLKHYFPNKATPKVFTCISEFGPAAFTLDTAAVGISLDMYLGEDFVYYNSVGLARYQMEHCKPENLPSNTMKAYLMAAFPFKSDQNRMIDQMIYNGKILYLTELMFPLKDPHLHIPFKEDQYAWCLANEGRMWGFFIEKELLYETRSSKYMKYLKQGPTSAGMPPESPGETGSFIGLQIVRAFMEKNPDFSLEKLMEIEDGQVILSRSKYKPKEGLF